MENRKYEEIIRFWSVKNLKRWSANALKGVNIPETSKEFLQHVGLPCNVDWSIRFDTDADVLPKFFAESTYRRIGFDGTMPLCLDESRNGAVVCVEASEADAGSRLVNTTVEAFGQCLTLYQDYRKKVGCLTEGQIDTLINEKEGQMRDIDKVSFDDVNNYWPVIIEQMRTGLL